MLDRDPSVDSDSARLIPARLIGAAAALAVVGACLLALLAVHVSHTVGPGRLDSVIDQHIIARTVFGFDVARTVADLGGPGVVIPLVLVLATIMILVRRPRAALLVVLAPAVASGLTEWVLKPLVQRMFVGTYVQGLGFPSGHSTGIFSLAFVIVVVTLAHWQPHRPTGTQWAISAAAVAVAIAVAVALVIARFHYPTDTVGGALVALVTVIALAIGIDVAAVPLRRARRAR